jgi:hypothetical protein
MSERPERPPVARPVTRLRLCDAPAFCVGVHEVLKLLAEFAVPEARREFFAVELETLAELLLRDAGLVAAMPAEGLAEAIREISE